MEQTDCSERSAYKIQTPGIVQKKEYNISDELKKRDFWNGAVVNVGK
jgi:hypothetical protein